MKEQLHVAVVATLVALCMSVQAADSAGEQFTAWERFKAYAHHENEVAASEGHKLILATDQRIADLKKAAASATTDFKARYDTEIKSLQASKNEAQAHLEKMRNASAAAWESTRSGFAAAYRDLHQAYDKAAMAQK